MTPSDRLRLAAGRLAPPADDPDADLLARFAASRDEAAFAELVRRHGPMVLAVCRRVLGCPHDAEDAFQAAFLVLARRAGAVRVRGSVGDWLFGVARRTALAARRAAARRRAREARPVLAAPPPDDAAALRAVLDEELDRLPAKYRAVLVLADLEGKGRRQVAAELGVPEGTVASRQARARSLLAARLSRRGWGLPAVLAAVAPAAVPGALAAAAVGRSGGSGTGGRGIPEALAQEVLTTMTRKKLALAAVAVVLGGGLVGLTAAGPGDGGPPAPQGPGRYAVSAAGGSALLLDSGTGDTWVLTQGGKEPIWVPVRRPAAPAPEKAPPEAKPAPPAGLELRGYLVPARSARVHAAAPGLVTRVNVREGQAVKTGDVLAELDDTEARLAVDAGRAELVRTKANLADADAAAKAGAAPVGEHRRAQAEVRRAEVALMRAEAGLRMTRVTAPLDGTVVRVGVAPGEAAGPSGPVVAEVATLGDLHAVVDVPERDAGRVSVGQPCAVRVAAGGAEYPAAVVGVAAVVDPMTASVRVTARLKVPDGKPVPRAGSSVTLALSEAK